MAKEYFKTYEEYKEFDSEKNRIIIVSNSSDGRFYFSVDTLESDVHFDGALFHEKMAVKRTIEMANDYTMVTSYDENNVQTQTRVYDTIPHTNVIASDDFDSVKQSVLQKLQQLDLI